MTRSMAILAVAALAASLSVSAQEEASNALKAFGDSLGDLSALKARQETQLRRHQHGEDMLRLQHQLALERMEREFTQQRELLERHQNAERSPDPRCAGASAEACAATQRELAALKRELAALEELAHVTALLSGLCADARTREVEAMYDACDSALAAWAGYPAP